MVKRQRGFKTGSASAKKKRRTSGFKPRAGKSSVARTRGGQVTGEMKYFDTSVSDRPIANAANWTATTLNPSAGCLFAPIPGTAINQREGKAVKLYKIKIRGQVFANPQANDNTADSCTLIRLCLVQDTQSNASNPDGVLVITPSASSDNIPNTFQQIDNFGRFRMLKDMIIKLDDPAITWNGATILQNGLCRFFKINVVFREPIVVRFNATNGGTYADLVSNNFFMIGNSDSPFLAPRISYGCRCCYKE